MRKTMLLFWVTALLGIVPVFAFQSDTIYSGLVNGYINKAVPDRTIGSFRDSGTDIELKKDPSYERWGYLSFPLHTLDESSGEILLNLFITSGNPSSVVSSDSINLVLYGISGYTIDDKLTWNNKTTPTASNEIYLGYTSLTGTMIGQYLRIDVTDFIRNQRKSGATTAYFRIRVDSPKSPTNLVYFRGYKEGTAYPPMLVENVQATSPIVKAGPLNGFINQAEPDKSISALRNSNANIYLRKAPNYNRYGFLSFPVTPFSSSPAIGEDSPVVASIENSSMRLRFFRDNTGSYPISCRTEVWQGGKWHSFLTEASDHKVLLLTSSSNQITHPTGFLPAWNSLIPNRTFSFEGKEYYINEDKDYFNPYLTGKLSEAIPIEAYLLDDSTIEVHYRTDSGVNITGHWKLPTSANHIELTLTCRATESGLYSMGIEAFKTIPHSNLNNILLPPLYQYKRLPESPNLILSSMMQQPLAIAEAATKDVPLSVFVCGDISSFSKDWGSATYSPMGFSIKNEYNGVRPVMFSPILGMPDSHITAGESFSRKFILGMLPDTWNNALEYISDSVFLVKDYRRQQTCSLTDALFNMVDLMHDPEFSGWEPSLKGFYDIEGNPETAPTVVQSSPLAVIAASLLSGDESLYLYQGLPTIEYTLSRSGYRWATDIVPTGYNNTEESLRLNPFTSQFNTTYYEGIYSLLGELNPWLASIGLPDGEVRKAPGYAVSTSSWVQSMAAYHLTGEEKWKTLALSTADRYIRTQIYSNTSVPMERMSFYNASLPSWWDLIDLYETTHDSKYLEAAQYGAAHTLAGIRVYPSVTFTPQTIHPDNEYEGNNNLWWKGKERYRLGFPRVPNDAPEKVVEDWLVSPVGLGFEQAGTYFLTTPGKLTRPVFMSNWSPHLLRLFQYTGKPVYETYARNGIIGRFANYPGYYATGYTDITMSPEFPLKGPDVSSIYFHHIPSHFGFTWDYLVAEAIQRSGGNIRFPYCKQEGFVWFANRIYGRGPGKVFHDNTARLWMRRGLVNVDNPSVNYITALSENYFWVILSGESEKEEQISINLGEELSISAQSPVLLYSAEGKIGEISQPVNNLSIPSKGFRALAYPLATVTIFPVYPKLTRGIETIDTGTLLGKIYLFRIRSPFGWDSVYGFCETPPLKSGNATVEINCNGAMKTVSQYPFEWSFSKFEIDENLEITIRTQVDSKENTFRITLATE